MSEPRSPVMTGGCQCGAVRYALYAAPEMPDICHCRMCQKAFGSYYAPIGDVPLDAFAWTRGQPASFHSSERGERGFCADCGTPLYYRDTTGVRIGLSLGSMDDPTAYPPIRQIGVESALPFVAKLADLPGMRTEDDIPPEAMAELKSRQHPDHDTPDWPLADSSAQHGRAPK